MALEAEEEPLEEVGIAVVPSVGAVVLDSSLVHLDYYSIDLMGAAGLVAYTAVDSAPVED